MAIEPRRTFTAAAAQPFRERYDLGGTSWVRDERTLSRQPKHVGLWAETCLTDMPADGLSIVTSRCDQGSRCDRGCRCDQGCHCDRGCRCDQGCDCCRQLCRRSSSYRPLNKARGLSLPEPGAQWLQSTKHIPTLSKPAPSPRPLGLVPDS